MPNFVKISFQIKKVFIQEFDFDRSVCMTAICFNAPISAIPTNARLLGERRTCGEFQIDVSKTEGLAHIYTARQTDKAISTRLVTLII